jgi:hypothetical protein
LSIVTAVALFKKTNDGADRTARVAELVRVQFGLARAKSHDFGYVRTEDAN